MPGERGRGEIDSENIIEFSRPTLNAWSVGKKVFQLDKIMVG